MIIQNPLLTGSLSYNGADLSNVTSSNANSASVSLILTAVSSSNQQLSASYIALSASYNVFSGSASTRITTVSSSQQDISASLLQVSASYIALSGSYNTFSGSASTRVTKIENNYATTGSNSFRADQSITGSLVVSSTITAQTLVVQTVTSSILYSSGSNLFGNQLANTQTFTGSVNITGSLALAGNITSNGTAVMLGTGSANYLSKFTGASTIGNSQIFDNGTNVGISTATLVDRLTIYGGIALTQIGAEYIYSNGGSGGAVNAGFQFDGTNNTIKAFTNNTTKMTLNSSGNLGLGVTPSAWYSTGYNIKALQIGSAGALFNLDVTSSNLRLYLSNNAYVESVSAAQTYIVTGAASQFSQENGAFFFYQAASGTANTPITFTTALTIASTGAATFTSAIIGQQGLSISGYGALSNSASKFNLDFYSGNTRFYSLGANTTTKGGYEFHTNSSDGSLDVIALGIASTGAATINAPTTDYAFTVNGTALWYTARFIGSATTGQSYGPLITAGSNSSDQSFIVQNKAASSNYFVVRGDGNVGIGTNTPNTYLQIVGNISTTTGLADAQFLTISNSNATPNNYSCIMFKDSDGNNSAGFGVQQISHITNEADIVLSPRLANGDITERMRIKGDGNVGIGTISPDMNGYGANHTILGLSTAVAGKSSQLNLRGNSNATANVMIGTVSYLDSSGTGAGSSLAGIDVYSATATSGRPGSYMVFLTNDGSSTAVPALERMRITSGGNVGIGDSTNASFRLSVTGVGGGVIANCSGAGDSNFLSNSSAVGKHFMALSGASTVFYVASSGQIYSTSTSIISISDIAHKENIKTLETGLNEVMALKPSRFDWKKGRGNSKKNVAGFIAQDLELILPDLVEEYEKEVGSTESLKGIKMTDLIPTLVKAIQELKATNDDLQSQINELKAI